MSSLGLIILLMLILSGFFSGLEIAFVSSNRLKHELDLKREHFSSRILNSFYNNSSRFIGALLLGNNIALVVYGIAMAAWLEPILNDLLAPNFNSDFLVLLSQTIISTIIILITAEFIPKILFRINPNHILKFFAMPVWLFYVIFYPLILIYIGFAELLLKKVFRLRLSQVTYNFSGVDLDEYVKDYLPNEEREDEIDNEIQMIQNAMDFKNVKLRDCMVPRTEIKAVELKEAILRLKELFTKTGHSKIMVFQDSIDNLLGYVHAYDIFSKPANINEVLRKAEVFPETTMASTLLDKFIKSHTSMAIVVDEFGGTSGIVTMEDIIEEIFGEIEDEYDQEQSSEIQIDEYNFIFSTRLEIDYLNEKYKLNIPVSDEYGTLAGFILHYHESIPVKNELIQIPPFNFTVIKSSENRLDEVKLEVFGKIEPN